MRETTRIYGGSIVDEIYILHLWNDTFIQCLGRSGERSYGYIHIPYEP